MNRTFVAILALITGLSISIVAAYYSIVGLTTIFPGQYWSVVVMGTVLELGKLVSVSWLYNNWTVTPRLVKGYLFCAVFILMFITSMGIFGYLSKAHIEQKLGVNVGVVEQIEILDNRIKIHIDNIVDINRQLNQIDVALEKMTSQGQAKGSIAVGDQQKKNKEILLKNKQTEVEKQVALKIEKIKVESELKKMEAEIGPIKYVTELLYDQSDIKNVDKTIRYVIILLILVFDPLAILLLLSFNISISAKDENRPYTEIDFLDIDRPKRKYVRRNETNQI